MDKVIKKISIYKFYSQNNGFFPLLKYIYGLEIIFNVLVDMMDI